MPINNKSVVALMASAIFLVATAVVLYAFEYGLIAGKAHGERKNHSEVRAAYNPDITNENNK
jgi:hypothetical protein